MPRFADSRLAQVSSRGTLKCKGNSTFPNVKPSNEVWSQKSRNMSCSLDWRKEILVMLKAESVMRHLIFWLVFIALYKYLMGDGIFWTHIRSVKMLHPGKIGPRISGRRRWARIFTGKLSSSLPTLFWRFDRLWVGMQFRVFISQILVYVLPR